jgi:glutamine synthetase
VLNPSVNAYRRLDPHYEAPNQISASAINRGAMVRIPLGNERSARIEVRSVAPDANPYMVFYTLIRTGLDGPASQDDAETKRGGTRFLPGNIIDAIRLFKSSKLTSTLYGEEVRDKFAELKQMAADRCPKQLGTLIKPAEVQFHHEVTNQWLWSMF